MPNFQTHWVVAWEALKVLDGPAAEGRKKYETAGQTLTDELRSIVEGARSERLVKKVRDDFKAARETWQGDLSKGESLHATSCFSAFMLGAVGPDFWMVPSNVTGIGLLNAAFGKAASYFNLGHYNRTHQQFRRSIAAVGGKSRTEQLELEQAYFCGMATHLAADLFIHQFVNVTAGAYNLLQENYWKNEHGGAKHLPVHVWNMHNKVEQYLDSYMRYRFFGDLDQVFRPEDDLDWFTGNEPGGFQPMGLPLIERLRASAEQLGLEGAPLEHLRKVLWDEDTRVLVERPLIFPAFFVDRLVNGGKGGVPKPFVYQRVVSRENGAYTPEEVRADLLKEATGLHMGVFDPSEVKRARYFSGRRNDDVSPDAWNYLVYRAAPSLERLRGRSEGGLVNGCNRFYDLKAMRHFGARAVELARTFVRELQGAYRSGDDQALKILARFWNLDTGLGLEVQGIPSDIGNEVITRLDFLHVLDERVQGKPAQLGYTRSESPAELAYLSKREADPEAHSKVETRAFPAVRAERVGGPRDIVERSGESFLDRIRVGAEGASSPSLLSESLEEFFSVKPDARSRAFEVETAHFSERNELHAQEMAHRLTLELRIAVPDYGEAADRKTADEPAMFFYCDQALGIDEAAKAETLEWLEGKAGKKGKTCQLVDFSTAPDGEGALRRYTARILVNLEAGEDPTTQEKLDPEQPLREVDQGKWNNVVPWGPNKRFYGRNFAIGTGRRFVLNARDKAGALFEDPPEGERDGNLFYFDRPYPTEHVFLTIYPLVRARDGKVYDAFSKEPVESKKFQDELKKVWGVGWVKVVLLYVLGSGGCAQLDKCLVDGLVTPVRVANC